MEVESILRLPAVKARTGLSRSSIYLLVSRGQFPRPISLGARAVGWIEKEISSWISGRIERSRTATTKDTNEGGAPRICWIAAELYGGWDDPRTRQVRHYLSTNFRKHRAGRLLMELYERYGERIAAAIRRHPGLRIVFRPIFDFALARAIHHEPDGDLGFFQAGGGK
jgi:prophage regulatory protein